MTPDELLGELRAVRDKVASEGAEILRGWRPWIDRPRFAESAANLAGYLALRHHDLRPLQSALMVLGLSSLGRAEGRVLVNLDATLASLASVAGAQLPARPDEAAFFRGNALLAAARDELFGSSGVSGRYASWSPARARRPTTRPSSSRIALAGADAVRINCAHDDADAWRRMIAGARRAEAGTGRRLRVLMDLAGPKIRTEQVRHPPDRTRLAAGDRLLLCRTTLIDRPNAPAFQATCTLPQLFEFLAAGQRVYVDDGRFGGTVEQVNADGALSGINHTGPDGAKAQGRKGPQLPRYGATRAGADRQVRQRDIETLCSALAERVPQRWREIAIVAKIETPLAVRHLPQLIVRAAGSPAAGADDRARRSCRRDRLRASGGNAGGDPVARRGCACAGDLGAAGAREPGQEGPALARRDDRRRHGRPPGMRDAEQRPVRHGGRTRSGPAPRPHGRAPEQEDAQLRRLRTWCEGDGDALRRWPRRACPSYWLVEAPSAVSASLTKSRTAPRSSCQNSQP